MSRNDVTLVVEHRGRYYVLARVCADTQWNEEYARARTARMSRSTRHRARALVLAHDIDRRLQSEYGVRELFVP